MPDPSLSFLEEGQSERTFGQDCLQEDQKLWAAVSFWQDNLNERINIQTFVVNNLNNGADTLLRELWRSGSKRAISKEYRTIIGFD